MVELFADTVARQFVVGSVGVVLGAYGDVVVDVIAGIDVVAGVGVGVGAGIDVGSVAVLGLLLVLLSEKGTTRDAIPSKKSRCFNYDVVIEYRYFEIKSYSVIICDCVKSFG